ncbi:MAG: transposase [Deltaproteobacteria bacterium]|nr:transposase [Deltaproteobacteria bacterium]
MASGSEGQQTFTDYRMRSGRGGPRPGAGRKPSGRRCDPKQRRERFSGCLPVHVTLRVRSGLPSLRRRRLVQALRKTFAAACEQGDFRLVHHSIQRHHLHLIVEADGQDALSRGMRSLGTRIALAVQRVFEVSGRILEGAYHTHILRTPREARHALRYVLLNARKHFRELRGEAPPVRMDECSSGRWFEGWKRPLPASRAGPREVGLARTWLLSTGWRRHGLIDPAAVPGS